MQDGLTGSAWGDWANYTASPLRAFENELGAQVGRLVMLKQVALCCKLSCSHVCISTSAGTLGLLGPIGSFL